MFSNIFDLSVHGTITSTFQQSLGMFQSLWGQGNRAAYKAGCRAAGVWCFSSETKEMGRLGAGTSLAQDLRDTLSAMSALCTFPSLICQVTPNVHRNTWAYQLPPHEKWCYVTHDSWPSDPCTSVRCSALPEQPRAATSTREDPLLPRGFHSQKTKSLALYKGRNSRMNLHEAELSVFKKISGINLSMGSNRK